MYPSGEKKIQYQIDVDILASLCVKIAITIKTIFLAYKLIFSQWD